MEKDEDDLIFYMQLLSHQYFQNSIITFKAKEEYKSIAIKRNDDKKGKRYI